MSQYLIWSNEHRKWWRPARAGYCTGLNDAGRYSRDEALAICRDALPGAAALGTLAEIPVRLEDVYDFVTYRAPVATAPACVFRNDR